MIQRQLLPFPQNIKMTLSPHMYIFRSLFPRAVEGIDTIVSGRNRVGLHPQHTMPELQVG